MKDRDLLGNVAGKLFLCINQGQSLKMDHQND